MRKYKKIVLIVTLFVSFFVPQIIQNFHAVTVHHHTESCDDSCIGTTHFHKAPEHCSIHEFVFNIVSSHGFLPVVPKPIAFESYFIVHKEQAIKQLSYHYYYLRAPPTQV